MDYPKVVGVLNHKRVSSYKQRFSSGKLVIKTIFSIVQGLTNIIFPLW